MAPLVLHNVPDDELYVGKDGITRPFAVVGASDERRSTRLRRQASTTHGAFGRARSRGRQGSVGPGSTRRQQQQSKGTSTTTAADEVFGGWKKHQEMLYLSEHQQQDQQPGQEHLDEESVSQQTPSQTQQTPSQPTQKHNQPVEIILRGYQSPDYQYAAVQRYEQIAGRICEDYPRDPPVASRRYRSSLRDVAARAAATLASNGTAALTPAERQAVMQRAASGNHWVKVTFESVVAAEAALYASPQSILGCLVYAEPYRGVPLAETADVAVTDQDTLLGFEKAYHEHHDRGNPNSQSPSSQTVESGTVTNEEGGGGGIIINNNNNNNTSPSSSGTLTESSKQRRRPVPGAPSSWSFLSGVESTPAENTTADKDKTQQTATTTATPENHNDAYCRTIPTARKAALKAPELALLPRESTMRQVVKRIPLLHRLTGTVIGNQVPRKENGLFDWDKASLYWKLIWWLDFLFSLFSGEILDANKDD